MKNYYEILGVAQTSDDETITAAFKALMQKLDSGAHSATAGKDNTKDFNDVYAVLKAYEVLIDPDARREYDASLAKAKPQDVPPPTPKIPVVVEEEEVFVFPSANSFTEQQPSRWNTKIWLLPLLLLGFFLIYQIIQSKNSADPNEIVTVTVTGTANVRDAASSEGSMVLETLTAGKQLKGNWVTGSTVPSERWFELEGGGKFVWGGNLQSGVGANSAVPDVDEITKDATPRQTSDFEDLNRNALSIGRRCFAIGDEPACAEFDRIFSSLSTYEQKGVSFCYLEVTAYVSYSVPCGYEQQYLHVFTGGLQGNS